jgi:hypothetical protein
MVSRPSAIRLRRQAALVDRVLRFDPHMKERNCVSAG